jgi:hypothetical protein
MCDPLADPAAIGCGRETPADLFYELLYLFDVHISSPSRRSRDLVPMPGILECLDLSGGPTAVALGEEDVIILVAFERRVKIYKVNRFVFDIAAEYFQVIAVIQNRFDTSTKLSAGPSTRSGQASSL